MPWLVERRGQKEIRSFFEMADRSMDVRKLEVISAMAADRKVAVEVLFEAAVPAIGDEECHVWTFDERGRIASMRHYLDTAKHITAAGLAPPTSR